MSAYRVMFDRAAACPMLRTLARVVAVPLIKRSGSWALLQRSGEDTSLDMTRREESWVAFDAVDARSPPSQPPTATGRMEDWSAVQTLTCRVTGRTALRVACPT